MNQGYSSDWTSTQTLKVIKANGMVDVVVKGQRYMRWQVGDEVAERMAIVQLHQSRIVGEQELV